MADGDDRARTAPDGVGQGGPAKGETTRFRPQSTARYIAEMTAELAAMAREGELKFLAHLLEVAQLEAATVERRFKLDGRSG